MTDYGILTAEVAEQLIQARLTDVLPKLFASVVMPPEVKRELLADPNTEAWAKNPTPGIVVREPQKMPEDEKALSRLDKQVLSMLKNEEITPDEADAIRLARELTANGIDHAIVLTANPSVADHLQGDGQNIKILSMNTWGIACQADAERHLDIDRVRPELEKICPLNRETKQRVDLYQSVKHEQDPNLKKEFEQARKQGQVH